MRPRVLARVLAIVALAALALPLHAQPPQPAQQPAPPQAPADRFANVRIRAIPIAPGIAMLIGAGGNIGLCTGPDGSILIDDQFAELSERIRAAVDSVSGGKPIRFVINTHWHGDHVGGNEKLGEAGAVIIAQDNVRRRMSTAQFVASMQETVPASPAKALPIVTFTDSVTLHVNGLEMQVFHVRNAHTDGDAMVWFPQADALHMGDCLFNGFFPVIDVTNGGTLDGMIAADDVALRLVQPTTKIMPGHGPLADKAALQRFRDMLATVRQRLGPMIRSGKPLDAILAAHPLADMDSTWGRNKRTEGFIKTVYSDLSRARPASRSSR